MMIFYTIRHNTSHKNSMAQTCEILEGIADDGECPVCGKQRRGPNGDIKITMGHENAKIWPDLIACGDYPCFVVSQRFMDAMTQEKIHVYLGGKFLIVGPIPKGLTASSQPKYYWVDGSKHCAAKMNFERSGFVDAKLCPACGSFTYDIPATYACQHAFPPPAIDFDYDTQRNLELFTTNMSPTAFYCTQKLVSVAKKYKLTNIGFFCTTNGALGPPLKY